MRADHVELHLQPGPGAPHANGVGSVFVLGNQLTVDDWFGRLREVEVHGDFFLYPEEALLNITAALDGAPADLDESAYAERIAAAIPDGTEWFGSSPAALATAVRRALDGGPVDD